MVAVMLMKIYICVGVMGLFMAACGVRKPAPGPPPADAVLWKDMSDTAWTPADPALAPSAFRLLWLNENLMKSLLADSSSVIDMPMPDGTSRKFRISETPTVDPALLAQYPSLRTYTGRDVNDHSSTGKFDFTAGFHGYLFTSGGSVIINPVSAGHGNYYLCFYKRHAPEVKRPFENAPDSIPHQE